MTIKLTIPGDPVAQARPRMFKRGCKTMVYDPQGAFKASLRRTVREQLELLDYKQHMRYPRLNFWFYMSIPKSMTKAERIYANMERLKHVKKPDVDNLMKLYMDVMTPLVYADDNCASIGRAIKLYSQEPRTVILITESDRIVTPEEMYGVAI